ncbi:sigma-54 interaction domain-containing protein [Brevibacillus centrosporus]|uniref:sigma-54 interaction domain-containing protein n=1 Tax=Brevibacillus centrosporus TaxID=54910 RepID=UPI002E1E3BC1|nr:sigma 54-interacting transcriptional regulator [Brevibacillus centrosporus]MED1951218.1 sigma 54-interacting transcriptional regulator [Brevibacillus centrosporus]
MVEAAAIGTMLAEIVPGVVILDEYSRVVWHGGRLNDCFPLRDGMLAADIFPFDLPAAQDQTTTFTTSQSRKFLLRCKPLALPTTRMTILMLEELTDLLENKDARLACLESIIDSLDEGVIMSDYRGKMLLYNKAQEKLEGLKSDRVVGKYLWEAYNYSPELSEHRRVFDSGTPIIAQYRAHATIKGKPQYVTYSTYPIVKDGETIAVFSVSTNETKLKDLLHETLELKRHIAAPSSASKERPSTGAMYTFADLSGISPAFRNLIQEAENIALHNTDILIVGETGTGKELFAQSIHNLSKRSKSPFVAVNCAAIPENLLESTLFGAVKGAYTGATDQTGLFEFAQDGTLFLDEINSMPITLQSKLMRVLEERMIRRLGTTTVTPIRCAVISASNEDPQELINTGKIRLDLYYRIARSCLYIPPLRERKDDISFLLRHFIELYSKTLNKSITDMTDRLRELLLYYRWPGNVRELQHVIENLVIRSDDKQQLLDLSHLPAYLRATLSSQRSTAHPRKNETRPLKTAVSSAERDYILNLLEQSDWNITKTAQQMGMTRQSLQYHLKKLQLRKGEQSY